MEELLNKLIEKGWKPSGKECSHFIMQHNADVLDWKVIYTAVRKDEGVYNIHYTLRELVSKESGLWQFVCENHLYIYKMGENKNFIQDYFKNEYNECCYQYLWDKSCYEYYLLESALCNESDLEKFLLDNIKIEDRKKELGELVDRNIDVANRLANK